MWAGGVWAGLHARGRRKGRMCGERAWTEGVKRGCGKSWVSRRLPCACLLPCRAVERVCRRCRDGRQLPSVSLSLGKRAGKGVESGRVGRQLPCACLLPVGALARGCGGACEDSCRERVWRRLHRQAAALCTLPPGGAHHQHVGALGKGFKP
eukprot:360699-Chlamydomonas_euryale.AAC.4